MPRPGQRLRRKNHPGTTARGWDLPDNALSRLARAFIEAGNVTGLSEASARKRQLACRRFILWCTERGLNEPREITLPILERYQRHLYHYRQENGAPLSFSTQSTQLAPLKACFAWATRTRHLLYNPASELQLPKVRKSLARYVLSVADIERILGQADISTLLGIRDRAMMEVLYSSAIRRAELRRLSLFDVHTQQGTLLVRQGKGGKDRLVPLGNRAGAWVDKYLLDVRPALATGSDDLTREATLFLTLHGDAFTDYALGDTIKGYIRKAGIEAPGACHLFRHACATHMLENGADTRYLQVLLGHSDLSSTQIYTHVAINKLKEIHSATHPAKLERNQTSAQRNVERAASGERAARLDSLVVEATAVAGRDVIDQATPRQFLRRQRQGPRRRRAADTPSQRDAPLDALAAAVKDDDADAGDGRGEC